MQKYDVSIIVAVYNNDRFIANCIKSVLNQKYLLENIQLILVNDGSTDNSLEICKSYSQKYDNILVIDQENKGVSAARNVGIKVAEGKYIMILDSDDSISCDTVKKLINFFDEHYDEVDLVTYPIYNLIGNRKKAFDRYDIYDKGTGIYDLDEYIHVNQSTVNVIIKNEENPILYNEKMKLSEDQRFNIEHLIQKRKIGFVKEAIYIYRRHTDSVSQTVNHPYYCFDEIMKYNEWLLDNFKENDKVFEFIQSYVLSTIKWRIKSDQLYPYHFNDKYFIEAVDRIKGILSKININVIVTMPNMSIYHKMYLLKLKDTHFKINFLKNGHYQILANDNICLDAVNITILIDRFRIRANKINILALVRTPVFEINDYYPEIYLKYTDNKNNNKSRKIEKYFISNKSFYGSKIKTNNFYEFEIEIDYNEVRELKFIVNVEGHEINTNIEFSKFCPFNKKNRKYIIETNKKIIIFNKNKKIGKAYQFFIKDKNLKNNIRFKFNNLKQQILINKDIELLRWFAKTKKNIWLYSDREGIIDNAYYQFKHDIKKEDKIKRYYIYDGNKKIYKDNLTRKECKFLIKYGSLRHKILFLKSKKILTSFLSLYTYCPLHRKFNNYRDLMKYDLIYLQHGILHANLLTMYSKEFTEIDKIVVSSEFEKNNFINKYNYNEDDIIMSGMPRLQNEDKENESENKILFAPSWRKYLIGEIQGGKRNLKEKDFLKSNYFIKINNFLNSKELIDLLEKNDLKLDFQLHPIFREHANLFKINKKYINIITTANLEKYKLLITDFSSFQFDFVRLKRPIIYFVPDMQEFRAGLHTYRELDLPHEKAFGELTLNKDDLIKVLERIINNNYKEKEIYLKREENFFIDLNNIQDNLYNELMKGE